jgi:hypothetical protein
MTESVRYAFEKYGSRHSSSLEFGVSGLNY